MDLPRNVLVAYVALAAAIVAVWWNSLGGAAVFDDHFLVVRNPCFRDTEAWLRSATLRGGEHCGYRPARYVSYGVDVRLFGDTMWGHHLGNVLRHVLAAWAAGWLATRVFSRLGGPSLAANAAWLGCAVAAIWALHPVQTDAVSYVSGRRDILVGGWGFVATAAAWRAVEATPRVRWALVALVALGVALLAKELGVVFPIWALAGVWCARSDMRAGARELLARRDVRALVALAVVAGTGMLLWRGVFASHSHRALTAWWGDGPLHHAAIAVSLQAHYAALAAGIAPLIGDYHEETLALSGSGFVARVAAGALVLGGVAALVWGGVGAAPGWRRVTGWGAFAWASGLAPMSQIIPHHELLAEHWLYVPLFGAAVALVAAGAAARDALDARRAAWSVPGGAQGADDGSQGAGEWQEDAAAGSKGAAEGSRRAAGGAEEDAAAGHPGAPAGPTAGAPGTGSVWRAAARVVLGIWLVVSAVTIVDRNRDWATERAFYERVVEQAPRNVRAWGNLLFIHAEAGDWDALRPVCETTFDVWSPGSRTEQRALEACMEAGARAGEVAWVGRVAERLVERHPGHGRAARRLAEALWAMSRWDAAEAAAWQWYTWTGSEVALGRIAGARARQGGGDAAGLERLVVAVEGHAARVDAEALEALASVLAAGGDEESASRLRARVRGRGVDGRGPSR